MWFLRACVEPLHTLILVGAFLVYMHRRLCKLSVLTISKILKIFGGLASQFSWPQEVCCRLINQIQTELITQIYSYSATFTFFESIYCSYQTHVFFFQDFISSKGSFLWGGPIKLRNLFTTLLAITRLLDFEVTTLPYPTRSWKTTTRWSLLLTDFFWKLVLWGEVFRKSWKWSFLKVWAWIGAN